MLNMYMPSTSVTSANAVWFLVGPFDSAETVRHMPIYTFPFLIGRRQDLPLSLSCKTVSSVHAEITRSRPRAGDPRPGQHQRHLRQRLPRKDPVTLADDDLVQFANLPFRVRRQSTEESPHTVREAPAIGPWPWCSSTS